MNPRVESNRFPYFNLRLDVRGQSYDIDALIDTGFDGLLAVPPTFLVDEQTPDDYQPWRLADGTRVTAPLYLGTIHVGNLGSVPAIITILGDEPLVGRSIIERFRITLDHGQRVLVEP
jgi:predicted aspartyl protease